MKSGRVLFADPADYLTTCLPVYLSTCICLTIYPTFFQGPPDVPGA
ncbi:hypothetical protein ABH920_007895 [Catenulispora sp. EB89]